MSMHHLTAGVHRIKSMIKTEVNTSFRFNFAYLDLNLLRDGISFKN
jgi:hypothetical protein